VETMKTTPKVARKGVKEKSVAIENLVAGAQLLSSQEEKLMLMVTRMLGLDAKMVLGVAGRLQFDK
jgi:hypothetical protein